VKFCNEIIAWMWCYNWSFLNSCFRQRYGPNIW